jgi:transposase
MIYVGLDVHRDYCEVAIATAGEVCPRGRIATSPAVLESWARRMGQHATIALEATANALAIARVIEPHVAQVVLANPNTVRAAARGGPKTDRIDAALLARLLASGFLGQVWAPDELTRARRRLVSRRMQLVHQRTREKHQVHAVLYRSLVGPRPMSDLFGVGGRAWLAALELPADERLTVDGCLRQIDLMDGEIAIVECEIARQVLGSAEMRRLLFDPRRQRGYRLLCDGRHR